MAIAAVMKQSLPTPIEARKGHAPRAWAAQVEWKDPEHSPVTPRLIGTKVFNSYPLQEVVDFIDWNPFFSVRPSSCQTWPLLLLCCGRCSSL